MAKITMRGHGTVSDVAEIIINGIDRSGISTELVELVDRYYSDVRVTMLVFEKYYWRTSSRASLSVLITGKGDAVTVDAVGAGGGNGVFLNFSWGAEDSFVDTVKHILGLHGFEEHY